MMPGCLILAAGASSRLGQAKQLVRLNGETLLERSLRVAREAGCAPIVVVLGAGADAILGQCRLSGAEILINADWAEGMAASLRAGVASLRARVQGAVVMTCDQPVVDAEHLRRLMAAGDVVASRYADRNGVPAYFPAAMFAALMELEGDEGARGLLRGVRAVALVGGELDVDTAESLAAAERRYGGR